MARLFPSLPTRGAEEATPRVIGIDSPDADALMGVLSSKTARQILVALHDEPASASEVAGRVDTSLQNAQYHLGRMEDAELLEVVDTVYSEKGREMKLYAPADSPLVVVASDDTETDGIRALLTRLLGAVSLLAVVSLLVQFVLDPPLAQTGGAATSADSAEIAQATAETTAAAASSGLPPGLVFFAGGLLVIVVALAFWWIRR